MRNLLTPALAVAAAGAWLYWQKTQPPPAPPAAPPATQLGDAAASGAPAAGGVVVLRDGRRVLAGSPEAEAAKAEAAAAAAPRPRAKPAPTPEDAKAGRLRFYGVVYDLVTLEPVAGATARFLVPSFNGRALEVHTNGEGHFLIDLPRDERVLVHLTAPGYKPGQLEDVDPPYATLNEKERRRKADETAASDLEPAFAAYKDSDAVVRLDYVMIRAAPGQTFAPTAMAIEEEQFSSGPKVFMTSEGGGGASLAPVPTAPASSGRGARQIDRPRLGQ
jgi:hypothetical protein